MSRDCPKESCFIEKIKEFSAVLANVKLPLKRRRIALKYLVHFVGDVYQPLHLGNHKGQCGGKIRLTYLGKNVTLHFSETNIFIYPLFFLHNFLLHFFLKLLGLRAKIPSKRDDMTCSPQFHTIFVGWRVERLGKGKSVKICHAIEYTGARFRKNEVAEFQSK